MVATSSSQEKKKKRGRGPAKGLKMPAEGMYLHFNRFGYATGPWSKQYGQHIGLCASRINITIRQWKDVPEIERERFWTETKVCFLQYTKRYV